MAVRVMAATAAVMAGPRLGIVLLAFGMTPVLVLLVMVPLVVVVETVRSM